MKQKKDVIPDFRNGVNKHPHVVILGAGASLAAFPNGDKNGRKLPLMNSLVSTLGLEEVLKDFRPLFSDFEKLYSTLCENEEHERLKKIVEEATYMYFYEMEVQDEPTLYDYLILSLRNKDVIATFNWDPLLLQAWRRHTKYIDHLPSLLFLHGNVAVGYCKKCGFGGFLYAKACGKCKARLEPTKLLYPVEKKNYNSDTFIKKQWEALSEYLEYSYYITIFGYSAPQSDIEARNLMLKAIQANRSRVFSELDIIDRKSESEVKNNWSDFFYRGHSGPSHYGIDKKLRSNHLLYHPRRSCDAHASAYLMNDPWGYNKFPTFKTIKSMHKWVEPIIQEEREFEQNGKGFIAT